MAEFVSAHFRNVARRDSRRWIVAALGLTVLVWLAGLAGLLAIASRVHDDIPEALAVKLPLLQLHPELIFAGDSRTLYQVDAGLAAKLRGMPPGYAVNIAYHAGEPLALLAAIRREPERFATAEVVISIALLMLNEGIREATVFPQDVVARLGLADQITTFLPLRIGTLVRFIREAFASRLATQRQSAATAPRPADLGLVKLQARADYRWPTELSTHAHYAGWNLAGPKSRFELGALCDMAPLTKRLTVVFPPWATRYDAATDPAWWAREREAAALIVATGRRCGFDVLDIPAVPGLTQADFYDELHVNASGIPIYTSYLMTLLRR
jgi:hypothetical protein